VRNSAARDGLLLLLLCVAGFVLGRVQTGAKSKGGVDPISGTVHALVNPPARLVTGAIDGTSDFARGVFGARSLTQRNRELEALVQSANLYTESVDRLEREIGELRQTMGLPPVPGKSRIAADVIGFFPSEYRITLSAGRTKGVRPGLPVVNAQGLVGVVQTVEANTSQVTLIYSPTLKIGAVAQRDPPPAGLIRGESSDKLILEFIDLDAPAQVGDLITTSGFSDKIPGGIPIGKIVQLDDDKAFGTRRAQVFPNVQIGAVREVYVLR